jgi:probable phosphoglycerate mutase
MSLVALIRHGPTDWNAERRLQGRSDRPLSAAGRASVCRWRLPALLERFRPPGGETPREVAVRLRPWIAERARYDVTTAVTHRGVIRALYAEATGWDMVEAPADDLVDGAAQLFLAREDGSLGLIRTNLGLA